MSSPQTPPGTQYNQQHNQANGRGQVIVNQGSGNQIVNLHNHAARRRTGVAVLIVLGIDVVLFVYGTLAYTGRAGETGDLWRAGIMLVLLGITVQLIRRWIRQRL